MKIKQIELDNFAKYDKVCVSFDEDVTYLIGNNGSGKSTLGISAVWFMFQGIAEKSSGGNNPLIGERFRFIGPKSASAKGKMTLWDEKKKVEILVMRKLTKSGTELSFQAPEGYDLDQQWLNDLFNVFLIAPKKFTELTPKEQSKALGIDTSKFDTEIASLKSEYTLIARDIKGFGELVAVEKVETVDLKELQANKETIHTQFNNQFKLNQTVNNGKRTQWQQAKENIDLDVTNWNKERVSLQGAYNGCSEALETLQMHGYEGKEVQKFMDKLHKEIKPVKIAADLYPPEPEYIQELPDDSELKAIDQKIIDAGETNTKAFQYTQYLDKLTRKQAKEKELASNKNKQEEQENKRLAYIKNFKLPFSNLSIGDDGELLLAGKPIKEPYFSTGELLKIIPVLIASRNPELKYVFLQDFNLLDDDKKKEVEEHLTSKGFQLVVEIVGKEKLTEKNCILLKDNVVVENYQESTEPALI